RHRTCAAPGAEGRIPGRRCPATALPRQLVRCSAVRLWADARSRRRKGAPGNVARTAIRRTRRRQRVGKGHSQQWFRARLCRRARLRQSERAAAAWRRFLPVRNHGKNDRGAARSRLHEYLDSISKAGLAGPLRRTDYAGGAQGRGALARFVVGPVRYRKAGDPPLLREDLERIAQIRLELSGPASGHRRQRDEGLARGEIALDRVEILVAAARQVDDDEMILRLIGCDIAEPRQRVRALQRRNDAFELAA